MQVNVRGLPVHVVEEGRGRHAVAEEQPALFRGLVDEWLRRVEVEP